MDSVYQEFIQSFNLCFSNFGSLGRVPFCNDAITLSQWRKYYAHFSATEPSDDRFEDIVRSVWHVHPNPKIKRAMKSTGALKPASLQSKRIARQLNDGRVKNVRQDKITAGRPKARSKKDFSTAGDLDENDRRLLAEFRGKIQTGGLGKTHFAFLKWLTTISNSCIYSALF